MFNEHKQIYTLQYYKYTKHKSIKTCLHHFLLLLLDLLHCHQLKAYHHYCDYDIFVTFPSLNDMTSWSRRIFDNASNNITSGLIIMTRSPESLTSPALLLLGYYNASLSSIPAFGMLYKSFGEIDVTYSTLNFKNP